MSAPKEYLGDGVYIQRDAYGSLILTTENGYWATNTIVLEPEMYGALKRYVAALEKTDAEEHHCEEPHRCQECIERVADSAEGER